MTEQEMARIAEMVAEMNGGFPWETLFTGISVAVGAVLAAFVVAKPIINKAMERDKDTAKAADVQALVTSLSALSQSVNTVAQTVASRQDVQAAVDGCSKVCGEHREKEWELTRQQLNGQSKSFDKLCDSLGETTTELRRSVTIMETTPANVALQVGVVLQDRAHVERLQGWSNRIRELKARRERTSDQGDFETLTVQIRELESNPPNGH